MRHIRAIIYRLGFRPKCGSIWHSPTLHWQYALNSFGEDFEKAAREELARLHQEERQDTVTYALDDKYMVFRRDGQDRMGRKHFKDDYFVIDLTHDPHAVLILNTYADAVRKEDPEFATQLDETAQLIDENTHEPA